MHFESPDGSTNVIKRLGLYNLKCTITATGRLLSSSGVNIECSVYKLNI